MQPTINKEINFIKMHGLGNDFILIDARKEKLEDLNLSKFAAEVCDRHFGIGADGLILILPSIKANYRMRIFNPDGSEAEMCGNGIRCFAKYIYETSQEKKDVISVETLAGIILPTIIVEKGKVIAVEVDMGGSASKPPETIKVDSQTFNFTYVSMGNPHCVIFVDSLGGIKIEEIGPKIENHPTFPERTNIEFVEVLNEGEITLRVWERGVGETLSCGTGACAAVVASHLNGKTGRDVLVHLLGGNLEIEWQKEDNHVIMRGGAERIFEGKYFKKEGSIEEGKAHK